MPFRAFLSCLIALTLTAGAALAQDADCTLDGTTLTTGQTGMFYSARSVPLGQSCEAVGQSRQCANGTLSGKGRYRYDNCIELEEFLGVNTNRRPGQMGPVLLARTNTNWIRANVEVLAYKEQHDSGKADPNWNFADWDLYMGALTRLRTTKMQKQPGVRELLAYAAVASHVDGVDLHTHVTNLKQINMALTFTREFTDKPIIVTEFSFILRMRDALQRGDTLGVEFAERWERDATQKSHAYMACEVFGVAKGCKKTAPSARLSGMISLLRGTGSSTISSSKLMPISDSTQCGGGATFGLLQSMPSKARLNPKHPPWYLGFLFPVAAVEPRPDGTLQTNYPYFDDFLAVRKQRTNVPVK